MSCLDIVEYTLLKRTKKCERERDRERQSFRDRHREVVRERRREEVRKRERMKDMCAKQSIGKCESKTV